MKLLKPILKILISIAILYFVFQKIDIPIFLENLRKVNPIWMLIAFCALLLSQYVSSVRLLQFWKDLDIGISRRFNWHLYLLGMYYSLLLPSSIGGDGYKVYLLNKQYQTKKRHLVKALILDRLSGLLGLGIWLCLLVSSYLLLDNNLSAYSNYSYIGFGLILIAILTGYFIMKHFFNEHFSRFWPCLGLSMIVQALSLGSCLSIMFALGIFTQKLAYLSLFLVSSVAAVIPITVGGAGARELTFFTGSEYLPIEVNIAIALSVLFYLINVLGSMIGMYFSYTKKAFGKSDTLETSE